MSNREFTATRTMLANAMATAGAELLEYTGVSSAIAAIPNTEPPQYVIAGTLAMIAKALPAASVPPLTAPAPLTDELPPSVAPADVVADLRAYASNPGYSHNDYADTMRQAANCIESLRAMFYNYAVAPAPQQSEGLSDARIAELNREAQDQGISGIPPSIYLARAIEAELAKAAPAAPVQTAAHDLEKLRKSTPMAYVATDLDGHADFGMSIEEAKWRAGPSCDTIIALHDISTEFVEFEGKTAAAPVQAEQAQAEPVATLLAALDEHLSANDYGGLEVGKQYAPDMMRAIEAARTAIQAKATPVAWMNPNEGCVMDAFLWQKDAANPQYSQPVYGAPVAALPAQAEQAAAVRAAYENAAREVEKRFIGYRDDDADLREIATSIRALAAPSTATSNDTGALGGKGAES